METQARKNKEDEIHSICTSIKIDVLTLSINVSN